MGEAFIRGVKFAINKMNATAIIKMDADFQHDPKYVLDLVNKYSEGNDYIIGSRFIEGGEILIKLKLRKKGKLLNNLIFGIIQENMIFVERFQICYSTKSTINFI